MSECSSAKDHCEYTRLALRAFAETRSVPFPCFLRMRFLRRMRSRISVRCSSPIKAWGCCSMICLAMRWLACNFNRLSLCSIRFSVVSRHGAFFLQAFAESCVMVGFVSYPFPWMEGRLAGLSASHREIAIPTSTPTTPGSCSGVGSGIAISKETSK